MGETLRIGEYSSLGTMPYYYPLKHLFDEPNWDFIAGEPEELGLALLRGDLDVALTSPLVLANAPSDYLVFPDLGYAGRGHIKDILLFSDILLDDMDEMTLSMQQSSPTASSLMHVVLGRYLQYQNEFILGWGNADAFLLAGDAALRERSLARYSYVYDMGDLWRHYTGKPMIYYLWVVRKESLSRKEGMLALFHRLCKKAVETSRSSWDALAAQVEGYDWVRRTTFDQVWSKVEYDLAPDHFEGLFRFFEDCAEIGLIDDVPEPEYFEHE